MLRFVCLLLAVALAACGGSDDAPPAADGPVEPSALEALLPDTVRSLTRLAAASQLEGAEGFQIARATARYDLAKPSITSPTVSISLVDFGSREMARGLDYDWVETPQGDTLMSPTMRTYLVGGQPARFREQVELDKKTVSVVVAGRFLVEATGEFVDRDALTEAAQSVGFERLAALAGD